MLGELFAGLINALIGGAFDETSDRVHRRWGAGGCFLIAATIVLAVGALIVAFL